MVFISYKAGKKKNPNSKTLVQETGKKKKKHTFFSFDLKKEIM